MKKNRSNPQEMDPLYVIFEQHLYNFQDSESDRKTFISGIVQEYLSFLRRKSIAVPRSLESSIVEELADQVNLMLTKKIYGCLSIEDFSKAQPKARKRRARCRYQRIEG
ncbi:MAG: hypothetical protein ACK5QT_04990 [Oligoflexia bacterium]